MKAIVSSTNDPLYSFFIPIAAWCWNKLGIDVVCFMPTNQGPQGGRELALLDEVIDSVGLKIDVSFFNCPEYKEATYAQCSRLYAGALDLPEDELLFTSDVDMAVFKTPPGNEDIYIYGADLVPENQFPMCYATAKTWFWNKIMGVGNKTVQECLDTLLGEIDCENMRGNYWGKDQEILYNRTHLFAHRVSRARPGTQFASCRVDRDDTNWRSYTGLDLVDAHLWRPGYTDESFANIMELLQTQYPTDNFDWLVSYRNEYIKLL
jgi:hypothetical protein